MAVTAGQEHGLFIGGEAVEAASGEIRDLLEPATGESLFRAETKGVLFSTSPKPFNPFGL